MKKLYDTFILFIATGMFVGYIPFAPGTFGSIIGIAIYYAASQYLDIYQSLILLIVLFLIGMFAADKAEKLLHEQDSGKIVIDEIVGMYVTMFFIPVNFVNVLISFICFRTFDIIKPYPISYIDKHIHRGIGIMIDDFAAGISANIFARVLIFLFEIIIGKPL